MSELFEKICTACRADAPALSDAEIKTVLVQLPAWSLEVVDGVNHLTRVYRFDNFMQALGFTQTVGELAEKNNHHPALLTEWGRVKVSWWTHKIKGLHENDAIMAAKTEQLFAARVSSLS
ncbi:4a-hydroxytetrahydrobiopterin dehydratase [Cellvibrio sp. NN19]|uniref:4a-hydroxytetrahydrobiopterin dehydratase n=1 Tax=Cellvibrio chitinivorans TaxID=3102792 RepID=UPI002B40C334|nr:4a-hydroxytetrahydrobiopterin dehydratase [Cellvibrio sp. NN19]